MTIPGLTPKPLHACWSRYSTQKLNARRYGTRNSVSQASATWAFFVRDVQRNYGLSSVSGWRVSARDDNDPVDYEPETDLRPAAERENTVRIKHSNAVIKPGGKISEPLSCEIKLIKNPLRAGLFYYQQFLTAQAITFIAIVITTDN